MSKLKPCPFCGGKVTFLILDDEFNVHEESGYEADPWSGLQYGLCHEESKNADCPIATFDGEIIGICGYETKEEAAEYWNRRADHDER